MASDYTISGLSKSVLKTLVYYDLFDYPLTPEEIFRHLPSNNVTLEDIKTELSHLTNRSFVHRLGEFYSLQNEPTLESRRLKGNALAKKHVAIAVRRSSLIASFPFVQGVMISGSLSKGYADEKSDVDFFVVTRPGRLYIARTLLALYKRLFLFNSHKYFCINYFISSDHLTIKEHNIFTATELATLLPMYGSQLYVDLLTTNSWIQAYFPNFKFRNSAPLPCPENNPTFFKKAVEWTFNRCWPDALDCSLMKFTFNRWKRLYGNYEMADFQLAFRTNRHASKGHKHNYQKQVIARYEARIQSFIKSFQINLAT